MHRIVSAAIVLVLCAGAGMTSERSFRAGAQPEPKKPSPESRAKIIGEIRTDLDDAVDKLNRQDPGQQTRAIQDRILENLKKLLEPDDENPPPQNSDSSNPPQKPMSPPNSEKPKTPNPSDSPSDPKANPSAPPEKKPGESQQNASPNAPKPAPMSSPQQLPPKVEDTSKDERRPGDGGPWPPLPQRHRAELNSASGDRFVRRYEDLLREYYRALAESGRRE